MPDSHFVREGAKIAYRFTGAGAPFGYAHGVLLSRAAVRRLHLFDFDSLGDGRALLTYDARGHGQSTARPIAEDFRFANHAADLLGLIDTLDLGQPIDFAGSSLGCATVLHAAVAAPERFGKLVLMIPPVAWESGPGRARDWYLEQADAIETRGAAVWKREWADADPLPIFADYPSFDMTPDMSDSLLAPALRGVGLSDLPDPGSLARLQNPALVLAWDTDALHPVSTAERLCEALPRGELHVSTSVSDIQSWTDRIERFLSV